MTNTYLNDNQKLIYFLYLLGIGLKNIDPIELMTIEKILFKNAEYYEKIKNEYYLIKKIFDLKSENELIYNFSTPSKEKLTESEVHTLTNFIDDNDSPSKKNYQEIFIKYFQTEKKENEEITVTISKKSSA